MGLADEAARRIPSQGHPPWRSELSRRSSSTPWILAATTALIGAAGGLLPAQETTPTPAPRESAVVALDSRVLTFVPSRDDLTVSEAVLNVFCARPDAVRVNGEEPEGPWRLIELEEVAENRFALPPLTIEAPEDDDAGLVAVSVKVWFEQVGNRYDSLFYADADDRYALVSFATRTDGPGWERARARFRQNRVDTLEAFEATLSEPLPIELNDRPLSDLERLRSR